MHLMSIMSWPITGGIVPVNWLLYMLKAFRLARFSIPGGMVYDIWLFSIAIIVIEADRLAIERGSTPQN